MGAQQIQKIPEEKRRAHKKELICNFVTEKFQEGESFHLMKQPPNARKFPLENLTKQERPLSEDFEKRTELFLFCQ